MSRIFQRPMFRIGGSAGGITSGLRRGYAAAGSVAPVPPEEEVIWDDLEEGKQYPPADFETQDTEIEESTPSSNEQGFTFRDAMAGWDDIEPPQSRSGADFLMNLGLNLMSGPSTGNLWSNIGEAGKEPLQQFQKQKYADKMAKYKHALGKKQFMLDAYSKLNQDDKIALEREIDFWMSDAGGGKSREEALNLVMFRKPQNPKDVARQATLQEQENIRNEVSQLITDLRKEDENIQLTYRQGKNILDAKNKIDEKGWKSVKDSRIIIDEEGWKNEEGRNIWPGENEEGVILFSSAKHADKYIDGFVYVDITTGNTYKKQDNKLINTDLLTKK